MLRTARFGLCMAGVFVLSTVFAPESRAQYTYGTWDGVEAVTTTALDEFNQPTGPSTTQTFETTLTIEFDSLAPQYADEAGLFMPAVDVVGAVSVSPYGPNDDGLSGYVFADMYHVGYEFAYFDAIPGSYANVTFTADYEDTDGPTSMVTAYFQTVPEPSAFAEAALAIVALSIFACARRLSARWSGGRCDREKTTRPRRLSLEHLV